MQASVDFKRIGRTIKIFAVAQFGLVAMLVYMAILFQQKLRLIGRSHNFLQAVIVTLVIQLALFYPINKFAGKEVERDLALTGTGLSKEELKALTKKKRMADVIKGAVLGFFGMFIAKAPGDPLVLSVLFFSFILTILTYLQCYNFAAKRLMKK